MSNPSTRALGLIQSLVNFLAAIAMAIVTGIFLWNIETQAVCRVPRGGVAGNEL